ncbi:MAG: DUF5615 family PIN-like protein [Nitrospinales bacterium]
MRFLANENVPLASIRRLRDSGYDVTAVKEVLPGATDQSVLTFAEKESRIISTFDRDYGNLIFQKGFKIPAGVVYFRFSPNSPEEPAEQLLRLVGDSRISLKRKFTVLNRDRIRQRALPKSSA